MIISAINDIAVICAKKGIKEAILSPGSRCAPLSLAFIRHPEMHCRTISDERSAAFIALGMAQQLDRPVTLICTSGSAAFNYAPAIAEAFFQQIPLLVLTADRPSEWIDQWDGQTIRQTGIYGNHVKKSYTFPDSFEHEDKIWHAHRIVNEAINESQTHPKGPVHINIPIREPFYPSPDEVFTYSPDVHLIEKCIGQPYVTSEQQIKLVNHLKSYGRILIVPGQQTPKPEIRELLRQIAENKKAVVISELISNTGSSDSIKHHDLILQAIQDKKALTPDLIISFGKSILSKALKQFLRKSQAAHWHIQDCGDTPDTYQRLSKVIVCQPAVFLKNVLVQETLIDEKFHKEWWDTENQIREIFPNVLENMDFGEFKAINMCLNKLPSPSKLHLANSMAVRYASLLGKESPLCEVIANRGTSGIDGSNSTAVGCTFTTKEPVTLITGDMAFFYDRNAFWHRYNLPNLRIVVLNNQAGGIFRIIDGPNSLPELEEYFETRQCLNGKHLASEFGFEYLSVDSEEQLNTSLDHFYNKSVNPKILEIFTDSKSNAEIFKQVKQDLKDGINSDKKQIG